MPLVRRSAGIACEEFSESALQINALTRRDKHLGAFGIGPCQAGEIRSLICPHSDQPISIEVVDDGGSNTISAVGPNSSDQLATGARVTAWSMSLRPGSRRR